MVWLQKYFGLVLLVIASGCASNQQLQQLVSVVEYQNQQLAEQGVQLESLRDDVIDLAFSQQELVRDAAASRQQLSQLSFSQKKTKKANPRPAKASNKSEIKPAIAPQKMTVGRVEWLWLDALSKKVKARIDTGAKSSSLHASNIQFFERDGERWVRFNMNDHPKIIGVKKEGEVTPEGAVNKATAISGTPIDVYEAPLVRMAKIKQVSAEVIEERPVVRLRVRLGSFEDDAEFTLVDRNKMLYPVLIGRSFLMDVATVDVSHTFMQKRPGPEN